MKLLAKSLLVFMAWGTMTSVVASSDPDLAGKVTIKEMGESKVQLIFKNDLPENVQVQILNEKNREVFSETIRHQNAFKKPYDLSQLPYGTYTFKVQVDNEAMVHEVDHQAPRFPGNVKVLTEATGKKKTKFMVLGPYSKDFTLRIYDDKDHLILQESIKSEGNYAKVYSFRGTRSKTAEFILTDKSRVIHSSKVEL